MGAGRGYGAPTLESTSGIWFVLSSRRPAAQETWVWEHPVQVLHDPFHALSVIRGSYLLFSCAPCQHAALEQTHVPNY